jgi:hypothetical protein
MEKYFENRCFFAAISDLTPAIKTGLVLFVVIRVMINSLSSDLQR